jgi:hypothetical protein
MKFGSPNGDGGIHKGGRPRGARNQLDAFAYACALARVQHNLSDPPPDEYAHTNLWKALTVTLMESPCDYVARVFSMLPKQLAVEHSQLGDLSDDEVNALLEYVQIERAKLIDAKPEPEPRMILQRRRSKMTPVSAQGIKIVETLVPKGE